MAASTDAAEEVDADVQHQPDEVVEESDDEDNEVIHQHQSSSLPSDAEEEFDNAEMLDVPHQNPLGRQTSIRHFIAIINYTS